MLSLIHLISIIIIVADLMLGIGILWNNYNKKANRLVFGIAVSSALWIFTNLMVDISKTDLMALRWSQLTILGPIFMPFFFLYLSYVFPYKEKIKKIKLFLIFSPVLIFLPFLFTRYNIERVRIIPGEIPEVVPGFLYSLFFIYFIIYSFYTIYRFFKKSKKCSHIEKLQISYIAGATIISFLIGSFTNAFLLLMGISRASSFGPLVTIIWISGLTVAILKHHLFNIKIIVAEVLVAVIGIILFIQIFITDKTSIRFFNTIIFLLFCIFGYLLIRSVLREIKLKEELEAANKELKRLDEAKTEFLSIASHQLRTPLTAIKGYIGMIEEGIYGEIPEKVKEILNKVNDSNERLIRLVNSLLDISRLELGRMEFEFEKVDIEEMLENIVDEFHIAARKKGLKLVFEHPKEKLPEITIDALKMRQVFLNLVDNAIKYTYEGEIIVKAELKDHGNERIRVSVSDTGMGIARNEIDQIFKIYRRGTGVRLFPEGSGVGLYVAKKIVEAHNGKIWVKSQGKGRGSTFYVELPLKAKKPNHL